MVFINGVFIPRCSTVRTIYSIYSYYYCCCYYYYYYYSRRGSQRCSSLSALPPPSPLSLSLSLSPPWQIWSNDLGLRSGFEPPDLDRPGRLPHQRTIGCCFITAGPM